MKLADIVKVNNKFEIKVIPNANSDKIIIVEENGQCQVRVYVTVTPEDGKANQSVVKLIAKELKVAKTKVKITRGLKSRNKFISIEY